MQEAANVDAAEVSVSTLHPSDEFPEIASETARVVASTSVLSLTSMDTVILYLKQHLSLSTAPNSSTVMYLLSTFARAATMMRMVWGSSGVHSGLLHSLTIISLTFLSVGGTGSWQSGPRKNPALQSLSSLGSHTSLVVSRQVGHWGQHSPSLLIHLSWVQLGLAHSTVAHRSVGTHRLQHSRSLTTGESSVPTVHAWVVHCTPSHAGLGTHRLQHPSSSYTSL